MATLIAPPHRTTPVDPEHPYLLQIERWRPLYRQRCRCVYLRIQARAVIGDLTQRLRREQAS